jgi:hypothetical protein
MEGGAHPNSYMCRPCRMVVIGDAGGQRTMLVSYDVALYDLLKQGRHARAPGACVRKRAGSDRLCCVARCHGFGLGTICICHGFKRGTGVSGCF